MSCSSEMQKHPARMHTAFKTTNSCAALPGAPHFGNLLPVFQLIRENLLRPGCITGINGVDASGKTQFTTLLSKYLTQQGIRNTVICIDDFHNPAALRRQGANAQQAYYQNAFDLARLVQQVLDPWKRTGCLRRRVSFLSLQSDRYDRALTLDLCPGDVMLLEGSLLFRPPVLPYLDTKIFLDVSFPEVLRRAARRDIPRFGPDILKTYREKYIPVQQRYFQEFSPKDKANLVIDNEDYQNPRILRITPLKFKEKESVKL